jgi:ABC-2 type transport system ATP-binding protein
MEEAECCDRVAGLHQGKLVGVGAPAALKHEVGGDLVVVQAPDAESLRRKIRERFGCDAATVDGNLRLERPRGHEFVRELVDAFPADVTLVTYGKPTLEEVVIHHTGHRFWAGEAGQPQMTTDGHS